MAPSESVLGKKQYYYVNGEAVELSPDKKKYEEAMKQKMEFSKEVDRFIWKIGQKHSLDDLVVRRTLSKFLELNVSDILRENNSTLFEREDAEKQCSKHCYLKLRSVIEADHVVNNDNATSNNKGKNVVSEMSQAHNEWSSVDKNLYLQGVEFFGRSSCGDGSLGEASQPIQCKNMQSLLKKHKKILLAMSDVHGWGAFTRHSLKKNEFLGEYTGELVSHEEAEERGRAETKNGFSYLFTLNDKLCIDARRKGNKLKFLNHSSTNPNCYAKLMVVRGDHRIGLFANRNIGEGEELFFDYCYGPGHADWSQ
ncbi:Histone-lysine N-methyltransferase MEDEA [Hirschfeldia incana]|nr:Histone-lysine N-methyltransferase MEDEA [Hirschfeldia incana]